MAKNFVTQAYDVKLTDGTTVRVCCALAMVNKAIKSYWPTGPERYNVCCHKGRQADIARQQNRELNDYFARKEGKQWTT